MKPLLGFVGEIHVEAIDKIVEDYVFRRDRLIFQLGFVNGKLQTESDKLSAKEKGELEAQKKDLEELLRSVEDSPDAK